MDLSEKRMEEAKKWARFMLGGILTEDELDHYCRTVEEWPWAE